MHHQAVIPAMVALLTSAAVMPVSAQTQPATTWPTTRPASQTQPASAPGGRISAVAAQMLEAWQRITTYRCRMRRQVTRTNGNVRENSAGTLEVDRTGDKVRFRFETREKRVVQFGGTPTLVTRLQVTINDGEKVWAWMEQLGEQQVVPVSSTAFGFVRVDALAERMQRDAVRCQIEDDRVGGQPVWHIRLEPKDPGKRRLVRHDYYVDKQHGVILRRLGFDSAGRERLRLEFSDFDFGVPIDKDRFVFRATPSNTGQTIRAIPARQALRGRRRAPAPPTPPPAKRP